MAICSVLACHTNSKTSGVTKDGVSFHRFPKQPLMKMEWCKATGRPNLWIPTKWSVICSNHFTSECFESTNKQRRLLSSAVPTLGLHITCGLCSREICNYENTGDHHGMNKDNHPRNESHSVSESPRKIRSTHIEIIYTPERPKQSSSVSKPSQSQSVSDEVDSHGSGGGESPASGGEGGSGRGGEAACAACGGVVGKLGRRVLGSPAEQFIEAAIFPRKLNEKTLLCNDCYNRYCNKGKQSGSKNPRKSSNTKGASQRVALSEESTNVKTLTTCDVSAASQQTIALPNYKRVPSRSEGCIFPDCPLENLHVIPQLMKQRLLRDYKLYIPERSQVCKEHLSSKEWQPLLKMAQPDFTAHQIEDVISTLATHVTAFNFNNIEDIPPNLLLYCTGINHRQLHNILDKLPLLKKRTKTPILALTVYLTKLNTNDSFYRLSTLFRTPITILEKLNAVAKDCMLKKFVQDHSSVSSSPRKTGKESEVVTEDDRVLRYLQEHYYEDGATTEAAAAMRSHCEVIASSKPSQSKKRKTSFDSDDDTQGSKARAKKRLMKEEVSAIESIEKKTKQYTVSEVGVEFENPERAEDGGVSESSGDEEQSEQPRVKEEPDDEGETGDPEDRYLVYAPKPTMQADPLDTVPAPLVEVKSEEQPDITVKVEPGEGDSPAQPSACTSQPTGDGTFTVYYTKDSSNFVQGAGPKR